MGLFARAKAALRTFTATYDGQRYRRRLANWIPTSFSTNAIMSQGGDLLRRRARDTLRNNPHATSAALSFSANLIGCGIKPSSLIADPEVKKAVQELFADWCDECDADEMQDFYGLQVMMAQALFEAGEVFIRFRPRRMEDGLSVPLQIQLLESEMVPMTLNQVAPNGNQIMNGIEIDFLGKRVAYWMLPIHPGDTTVEPGINNLQPVRIPAEQILHVFPISRPGQMRGVPLVTPALVKLFLLDQYDDAELDRKKTAAMYAGFVTSENPDDLFADATLAEESDEVGVAPLEPGTMQMLRPGETVEFSAPADVGGAYELFQYRQQLAVFAAMGVPYTLGTGDLKRANYSSLRGAFVEFKKRLEQLQFRIIVFQACRPVWLRWLETAVLSGAVSIPGFADQKRQFSRARWIAPRYESADPLKDVQADKLAVDAGFTPRSDVVESRGYDVEENDARIAADKAREEKLGLNFPVKQAAPAQPDQADGEQAAADAADNAAEDVAA